jgi:hypothetical protein
MKYVHTAFLLILSIVGLKAQSPASELYEQGIILIKLREDHRQLADAAGISYGSLQQLLQLAGGGELRRNFPAVKAPGKKYAEIVKNPVDLSRIYELKLSHDPNRNIDSSVPGVC